MSDSYTKQMFDAIEIEVKPLIAERDALFDDNERLGDRIVVLTAERDDYMLKQKVWEAANDELRSEHIRVTARIRDLEALLDECYESGRAPTSDELDRLKIPTASETACEPRKPMLSDMSDAVIRELHRQGMVSMRSEFDGAVLRIEPATFTETFGCTPVAGDPVCPDCGNRIDPDCCGCGESKEGHDAWSGGHEFVPMGCDCHRATSDRGEKR